MSELSQCINEWSIFNKVRRVLYPSKKNISFAQRGSLDQPISSLLGFLPCDIFWRTFLLVLESLEVDSEFSFWLACILVHTWPAIVCGSPCFYLGHISKCPRSLAHTLLGLTRCFETVSRFPVAYWLFKLFLSFVFPTQCLHLFLGSL